MAAAGLVVACNKHHKPIAPEPVETAIADSLVFTRSDSSVVEMGPTPLVCCGIYDPGFVNEPAMRIVLYDPASQKPSGVILNLSPRLKGACFQLPTSPY